MVGSDRKIGNDCWLDIPSWCDFTVSSLGNGDLIHSGDRTLLRIPPGLPVWQLKITRSSGHVHAPIEDYITIGNGEHKMDGALK